MQRLILIGCSTAKLRHAAPARDLYQGDVFKKARAWAERRGARWMVLSGLYGVVQPEAVIQPYEQTLVTVSGHRRRQWGDMVRDQLDALGLLRHPLEIVAGTRYREWAADLDVSVPLAGLGIGQQKAALAAMLKEPA